MPISAVPIDEVVESHNEPGFAKLIVEIKSFEIANKHIAFDIGNFLDFSALVHHLGNGKNFLSSMGDSFM